jgi:Domain of unknown function (DUF4170)
MTTTDVPTRPSKQLLHLVFGGELKSLADLEFANLDQLHIVGIYPSYAEAYKAWKAVAQGTVDNAHALFHRPHSSPARPQCHVTATLLRHPVHRFGVGSVALPRPT